MVFNKNNQKQRNEEADKEPLAILNKWNSFKRKLADGLQQRFQLLSSQTKKYTLILFCILFGGSSLAIIIHSVTTKTDALKIIDITKPARVNEDNQATLQSESIITKQEYDRVLYFQNYMLSLRYDSVARKKYDSIIRCRPQLMDSIRLIEKMYLSQNKK